MSDEDRRLLNAAVQVTIDHERRLRLLEHPVSWWQHAITVPTWALACALLALVAVAGVWVLRRRRWWRRGVLRAVPAAVLALGLVVPARSEAATEENCPKQYYGFYVCSAVYDAKLDDQLGILHGKVDSTNDKLDVSIGEQRYYPAGGGYYSPGQMYWWTAQNAEDISTRTLNVFDRLGVLLGKVDTTNGKLDTAAGKLDTALDDLRYHPEGGGYFPPGQMLWWTAQNSADTSTGTQNVYNRLGDLRGDVQSVGAIDAIVAGRLTYGGYSATEYLAGMSTQLAGVESKLDLVHADENYGGYGTAAYVATIDGRLTYDGTTLAAWVAGLKGNSDADAVLQGVIAGRLSSGGQSAADWLATLHADENYGGYGTAAYVATVDQTLRDGGETAGQLLYGTRAAVQVQTPILADISSGVGGVTAALATLHGDETYAGYSTAEYLAGMSTQVAGLDAKLGLVHADGNYGGYGTAAYVATIDQTLRGGGETAGQLLYDARAVEQALRGDVQTQTPIQTAIRDEEQTQTPILVAIRDKLPVSSWWTCGLGSFGFFECAQQYVLSWVVPSNAQMEDLEGQWEGVQADLTGRFTFLTPVSNLMGAFRDGLAEQDCTSWAGVSFAVPGDAGGAFAVVAGQTLAGIDPEALRTYWCPHKTEVGNYLYILAALELLGVVWQMVHEV